MTQTQLLTDLGTILLQAIFVISIVFIVGTSFVWAWWKSDLGWTIILETAAIAIILLRGVLHDWFGLPLYSYIWSWIGLVSFAAVGVTLLWRGIVIFIVQRYDPPPTKSGRVSYRHRIRLKRPQNVDNQPDAEEEGLSK